MTDGPGYDVNLVEILQEISEDANYLDRDTDVICGEAAHEIIRLSKEITRLTSMLCDAKGGDIVEVFCGDYTSDDSACWWRSMDGPYPCTHPENSYGKLDDCPLLVRPSSVVRKIP